MEKLDSTWQAAVKFSNVLKIGLGNTRGYAIGKIYWKMSFALQFDS